MASVPLRRLWPGSADRLQPLAGLAIRLLQLVVILWVISSLLFFLLRLTGDPAALLAGDNATPESIERIRQAYGFSDPLPVQYVRFLAGAVHLDFGTSTQANIPATRLILERFPYTAALASSALVLAILVSVPLGTLAAVRGGRTTDRAITMLVALGQSVPGSCSDSCSFWSSPST